MTGINVTVEMSVIQMQMEKAVLWPKKLSLYTLLIVETIKTIMLAVTTKRQMMQIKVEVIIIVTETMIIMYAV